MILISCKYYGNSCAIAGEELRNSRPVTEFLHLKQHYVILHAVHGELAAHDNGDDNGDD
jgi:hypothetical protein